MLIAFPLLKAHQQTVSLSILWDEFAGALALGDIERARGLTTYPDILCPTNWYCYQFTENQVLYCERDVAKVLAASKANYRRTLAANLGNGNAAEAKSRIVFNGGYAVVEAGRIKYIKIL